MPHPAFGGNDNAYEDKTLDWKDRRSPSPYYRFQLPEDMLSHFKRVAKDRGVTLAQLCRYVLSVETGYKHPENRD